MGVPSEEYPDRPLDENALQLMPPAFVLELIEEVGRSVEVGNYYVYDPEGNAETQGRPVRITSGRFMGTFGVSNFFRWCFVQPDGSLSEDEMSGYPPIGMGRTENKFRPISRDEAVALARQLS